MVEGFSGPYLCREESVHTESRVQLRALFTLSKAVWTYKTAELDSLKKLSSLLFICDVISTLLTVHEL